MGAQLDPNSQSAPFRFCFTLDTEPDNLWGGGSAVAFDHFPRLLSFHRDLVAAGARPTYLTTSEVAEDPDARRAMQAVLDHGSAELGAHFHSWTRAWPFPVPDLGDPPVHACVHHLGQGVEEAMLEYTCAALDKSLGVRPRSYRGGRWSLSGGSLQSLRNCGVTVDTTVTPGKNWADARHRWLSAGDFRDAPRAPYYLAGDSLQPSGAGEILELPVGASFFPDRQTANRSGFLHRVRRRLCRVTGRPFGLLWLRPTNHTIPELTACLEQLRDDRVPVSPRAGPCRPRRPWRGSGSDA